MANSPHFQNSSGEETASLYVLDLLSADERRDFEHRLRDDPKLRELVRELQGNVEAMVAEAPARPAPVNVWGRIAAQVESESEVRFAHPRTLKAWAPRFLAAAACVALGAFLHAWLASPPDPTLPKLVERAEPRHPIRLSPPTVAVPLPAAPQLASAKPSDLPNSIAAIPAASTNAETVRQLRERVRLLSSQVEALNHVLTQQASLPSGFSRLHVFRLVNVHDLNEQAGDAELQSLPDALAELAAGRQGGLENQPPESHEESFPDVAGSPPDSIAANGGALVGSTGSLEFHAPSTLGGGGMLLSGAGAPEVLTPTTGSDPNSASAPQAPVEQPTGAASQTPTASAPDSAAAGDIVAASADSSAASALSLNAGQPLGFYDPDSGRGSIALLGVRAWQGGQVWRTDSDEPLNYVVWQSLNLNDGTTQIRSVGTTPAGGYPGVISFTAEVSSGATPSFFVTLESGVTAHPETPTGPVVAGPP